MRKASAISGASLLVLLSIFAGCSGKATSSGPDAAPDAGDAGPESTDPALIIEPEIPPVKCDVAFDKVYDIPGAAKAIAWSVVELPNGHFVVAGEAEPEVPTTPYDMDGFLMDVDKDGQLVWSSLYGQEGNGSEYDAEVFKRVHLTSGGLMALGTKVVTSTYAGAWAQYTELDGGVVWSETLQYGGILSTYQIDADTIQFYTGDGHGNSLLETINVNGSFEEQFHALLVPSSQYNIWGWDRFSFGYSAFVGSLYIENTTGNYQPDETTYEYPYIVILSPNYRVVASKTFRPNRSGAFGFASGTPDGHILFGGALLYDDWTWGTYLAKVTIGGDLLWHKYYGDNDIVYLQDITSIGDDFLLTGYYSSGAGAADGSVAHVDGNGRVLWHWNAGHSGIAQLYTAIILSSNEYLFAGVDSSLPWLVKITPNKECY
ncbi:MAG: hypothetical protein PHU25_17650 [Deltaproteobacteria bacterium]|nr:hypothetical protein [Deltaproteobacteria bacterium]